MDRELMPLLTELNFLLVIFAITIKLLRSYLSKKTYVVTGKL